MMTYINDGVHLNRVFSSGSDCKESAYSAGDRGSIPGLERSPGEGNDYPPQYSCLENSMDRGAWWATVHGVIRVRHDLATASSTAKTGAAQKIGWSL